MGMPSFIFGLAHTAYIIWLGVTTFDEALSIVPRSSTVCCVGAMDRCRNGMGQFFELATKGPRAYKYPTANDACRAFFDIRPLIIINLFVSLPLLEPSSPPRSSVTLGAFFIFQTIGLVYLCQPRKKRSIQPRSDDVWDRDIELDEINSTPLTTGDTSSESQRTVSRGRRSRRPGSELRLSLSPEDEASADLSPGDLHEGLLLTRTKRP
jgi:hypothetical protein